MKGISEMFGICHKLARADDKRLVATATTNKGVLGQVALDIFKNRYGANWVSRMYGVMLNY